MVIGLTNKVMNHTVQVIFFFENVLLKLEGKKYKAHKRSS